MADEAPGWDAIDDACRRVYGEQEPRHVGFPPGVHLGAGLQGCSAYDAGDHWHYVTYGLTELWEKEEDADPEVSGWGYEFTFRVVKDPLDAQAPGWPFGLLESLARYCRENEHSFSVGDFLDTVTPITDEVATTLRAMTVVLDPTLAPTSSPNGSFEFRQWLAVTVDEVMEMQSTSIGAVVDRIREGNPLLVTDPRR